MKKIFLTFICLMLVFQSDLKAQDTCNCKNLVSINIPTLLMSNLSITYERHLNTNSLLFDAGITLKETSSESAIGCNFEFQYRLYPIFNPGDGLQGIFLAPYISYRYLERTSSYNPGRGFNIYNVFGIGAAFGLKVAFATRIVLTIHVGGGLRYSSNNRNSSSYTSPGYTGFSPKAGITMGYFF